MSAATHTVPAMPSTNTTLTVRDTMTLDLEASWWKYAGAKEATIRELFNESATRYYARLNALLDRPEAMAYAPLTVKRLRRVRERRRVQSSARRSVNG